MYCTVIVCEEYLTSTARPCVTSVPLLCCAVGVCVVDQPDDQFVSINGTLRLTCNVSGSEPISYQWLKDGQQLQDDGRVSGSNDSVLVVDPVEGDDFGGYQCNVSNEVDQVQSEVAVVAGECVCSDIHTYIYRNVSRLCQHLHLHHLLHYHCYLNTTL